MILTPLLVTLLAQGQLSSKFALVSSVPVRSLGSPTPVEREGQPTEEAKLRPRWRAGMGETTSASRSDSTDSAKTITRYSVVEDQGVSWFVRPNGKRFLSMGVCCIDQGATPKTYDQKNPGYAAYRNYANSDLWANDTVTRLQNWGFNTVGAWSDTATLRKTASPNLLFTPILHIGSSAGAPWKDMWNPVTIQTMDDVAKSQILPLKGDDRIVGFFSDNEMGWWYGAMWDWAFKAGTHSRSHLVALLKTRYPGGWSKLQKDFQPDGASSFEDLKSRGRLFLQPNSNGMATVHAWMSLVSDRYYSLCCSIIKKYDPGALYLGDRYISNFYPEVAASAGKYCDVVSTNLNADTDDGLFAPFYLPAIHAIAKRPILITEYYQTATENRTGNKNNSSGFPVVQTQAQRAVAFARQTRTLVSTPFILGAHWFQYYDEPQNGRGDGENYDMGLVDIENRPYDELVKANRALRPESLHTNARLPHVSRSRVVPYISAKSIGDIQTWLNHAALVPSVGLNLRGDLYVGGNENGLYAAIYWNEDLFPEALYKDGKVPTSDEPKLSLTVNGRTTTISARTAGTPWVKNGTLVNSKIGVRNFIIVQLDSGHKPAILSATFTTRCRAYRMNWSGFYTEYSSHELR